MEIIIEEILNLVRKKMDENGSYTKEAYKQFVEESIDYFIERGKLIDDDNLEFIESRLMDKWRDIQKEIGK